MHSKKILRKKYYTLRKKKYFDISKDFFLPLIEIIKLKFKKQNLKIALYHPSNFEINILKLLDDNYMIKKNILLPVIKKNNQMIFCPWREKQVLLVNEFGMLEPVKTKVKVPDLILVPVLAYDSDKNRLGYGKGFYDRYLNKYLKKFKNILTIGVAFSFQKHHKLPTDINDVKLNYILTEKGIY